MKIKGILLDKDGTLIEFEKTWHKVFQGIFDELENSYGLSKAGVARLKECSGFLEQGFKKESLIQYATVEEIIRRWVEEVNKGEEEGFLGKSLRKESLAELLERHSKGPEAKITPLENTLDTIKKFHGKGYILGIATADSKESTLHNLQVLGIEEFFQFIGCDDGYFRGKPDPHMGEEFCKRFQLEPGEVLYVGDSTADMLFAENNGFHFVGIKSSYNEYEKFIKNNYPVVKNIGEIGKKLLTGD